MYVANRMTFAADCQAIIDQFPFLASRLENLVALAFKSNERRAVEHLEKIEVKDQLPIVQALSELALNYDLTDPIRNLILEVMGAVDSARSTLCVLPSELEIASGISRNGFKTPHDANKILAIKVYRDRTGLGLREGKEAIDMALIARFGCHEFDALKRLATTYNN